MHFACLSIFDQINAVFSNTPVQPGPKPNAPNAVFPHLNSNNFQPLSNGFLSNETKFQIDFVEDS